MKNATLSARLNHLRHARGLTQSELARRAGTSTPTVSRYESGWTRFELYTLSKLATALGCRLRIELEPLDAPYGPGSRKTLLHRVARLFWDRPLRASHLTEHPAWVVKRVLEYGTLEDLHAVRSWFGREGFLRVVREIRFDSARTRRFWRQVLEQEGLECTRRFSRKEASGCWRG